MACTDRKNCHLAVLDGPYKSNVSPSRSSVAMLNQPRLSLEPSILDELGRLRRLPEAPVPLLRWAGSKLKTLPYIAANVPLPINRLIEPFVGSAIVFAGLRPASAILADSNVDLINFFRVLRDQPDELVASLSKLVFTVELYYRMRGVRGGSLQPIERAARFYFLNRYCWNGVYRLNKQGAFNVPVGKFKYIPPVFDRNVFAHFHLLLQTAELKLQDYAVTIKEALADDVLYVDPPYDAQVDGQQSSGFVQYSVSEFPRDEQIRLADALGAAARRGVLVIASNADTAFIRDIYKRQGFRIRSYEVSREINSKHERRAIGARELLITSST